MITITYEHLSELKTPAGGVNQATADVLGIMWPLQAGWMGRLVGTQVSDKRWNAAKRAAAQGPIYRRRGNTRRYA